MFCTQIQKIPILLDYVMLRNFGTVHPIFPKIASIVAQDSKEKSRESAVRGKKIPRNYRVKRRGGGGGWILGLKLNLVKPTLLQWNLVEVLGTMKITLLYQVSHYIRVKKHKYKELGPEKLPCYKRVCYIRPLYNEVLWL